MSSNDDRSRMSGWDAHRVDELDRALMTTPAQRLRWLEEAIAFASRVGALPPTDSPTTRLSDALEQEREERL